MPKLHGSPCWYEMGSTSALEAIEPFYVNVLGWNIQESGMEGFTYHLATSGGDMVAGLYTMPPGMEGVPSHWLIYFAVDDADAAARAIVAAGGVLHREPADIPGTGRFAVAADPRGAAFGILRPEPMPGGGAGHAFDQEKSGHGNWNELMTPDPATDFDFYLALFGWEKTGAVPMGDMGSYQLFAQDGRDIGGYMGLGAAPVPAWLPYFGVNGIDAALERVRDGGGERVHGPVEVPGGAFTAIARDPAGAYFAMVGPRGVTA